MTDEMREQYAAEMLQHSFDGDFESSHYKSNHQFYFSDLYDWMATACMVDISKKGTHF